jgi:hypothetical protein
LSDDRVFSETVELLHFVDVDDFRILENGEVDGLIDEPGQVLEIGMGLGLELDVVEVGAAELDEFDPDFVNAPFSFLVNVASAFHLREKPVDRALVQVETPSDLGHPQAVLLLR